MDPTAQTSRDFTHSDLPKTPLQLLLISLTSQASLAEQHGALVQIQHHVARNDPSFTAELAHKISGAIAEILARNDPSPEGLLTCRGAIDAIHTIGHHSQHRRSISPELRTVLFERLVELSTDHRRDPLLGLTAEQAALPFAPSGVKTETQT